MFGLAHFGAIYTVVPTEQQEFTTEYKILKTWTTDGLSSADIVVNASEGTITINKTGTFDIALSCGFKGSNVRDYDLAVFQDGIIQPQLVTQKHQSINLETRGTVCGGLLEVTSVPSVLDVRAKCNVKESNVMIVENATLSCVEVMLDISCKVTKSADQSIPNNTSTIITWNQEDYDTDGMHDNVTNNSRITIKTAGKYSVMAQFEWESNSTGKRIIDIMKNSIAVGKANYLASGSSQHTVSFVGDLAVDDILEVRVFQDSGGSLDFLTNITYFEAHKIN